ncbi:hypothetical protein [Salegentibacter sp. F14]
MASYHNLSEYYRSKSKQLSKIYANSLFTNSITARLNAIHKLIQRSPSEKIKDLSKTYIQLNDSIKSGNIRAKNFFAKIKYDEKQKQQKTDDLQAKSILQKLETEKLKKRDI